MLPTILEELFLPKKVLRVKMVLSGTLGLIKNPLRVKG